MLKLPLRAGAHSIFDGNEVLILVASESTKTEVVSELCERVNGQGWIAVEDRLPEESGHYLVFGFNVDLGEDVFECYYEKEAAEDFTWQWQAEFSVVVSHWQPLPPAPSLS